MKVVQIQKTVLGDNVRSEQQEVTTVLYDNGEVWEGWNEIVKSTYDEVLMCTISELKMKWHRIELPHETEI